MRAWLKRPLGTVLVAAAVAIGGGGILIIGSGDGPEAATANVWIDTSGGSCTRQSTAGAHVDAQACDTWEDAYFTAEPGDTILIKGGTYEEDPIAGEVGDIRIDVDPDKVGDLEDVVFEPAPGEDVTLTYSLVMYGSNAVFRGTEDPYNFHLKHLIANGTNDANSATDLLFENIDAKAFHVGPVNDVTLRGGDYGPNLLTCGGDDQIESKIYQTNLKEPGTSFTAPPEDITLDGIYLHDQNTADGACQHMGGIIIDNANGLTIRDSIFEQVVVYNIQITPSDNVVLENNWFGHPVEEDGTTNNGQLEVQLDEPGSYDNWLVRFNSFGNGFGTEWDGGATHSNFRVIGNIMNDAQCGTSGRTWAYNVFVEPDCTGIGTGNIDVASLPYTSAPPATMNFHLPSSTSAENHVTPTTTDYLLTTDIDGDPRPAGAARDAGSDERP